MVTMQQIADQCGVSRGTVDRALHHKGGVRETVAEQIRETARKMGYISSRMMMQQTQMRTIGVVLHSAQSAFVTMLSELCASFAVRERISNLRIIVRASDGMDVQHQLTLINELVTADHIDGLALMPLANTLIRDKINLLSEEYGIPVVTLNTDIADTNRIAYVGPDNLASGRSAGALMGLLLQGQGRVLPILGQRNGHYADSQRLTGFINEIAERYPKIQILHPECSFLDSQLAERITQRALSSDAPPQGIYLASAGRSGVYRALKSKATPGKVHVIVHDLTPNSIDMVREGVVDFVIGQDVQTQGTLPIRLLYDYLEYHHFPDARINTTEISIKFSCNL